MLIRPTIFTAQPGVVAGFSTRQGGVSAPPYDTLNLARHVGDDPANVDENRRRFCEAMGVDPAWMATGEQVHGGTVEVVNAPRHVASCDGFATDTPGLLLAVTVADCAAVLLADAKAGVVGACHSGWRGTIARIAVHTVEAMTGLGAEPKRIRAYISPCIALDAFEVGEEVAEQFDDAFVHRRPDWRRPHVDLKACIHAQLESEGLSPDHIQVAPADTYTSPDTFFSYRRTGAPTGCMLGAIGIR